MPGVTKEQIERAKEWDLLSWLQSHEPDELVRKNREYRTKTHDSLVISNGKWCWNSRGIGGRTALDYLIKVKEMDFLEAVKALTDECSNVYKGSTLPPKSTPPPKPFHLPDASRCASKVVSYLQGRGIASNIISRCIGDGILYESKKYHNCVFVGRNLDGMAKFACLRSTSSGFRIDIEGSDKRYNFHVSAINPDSVFLIVAESPIDILSVATLLNQQKDDWTQFHYLSLSGTAPRALLQFLHDYPKVTHISLCLDNDKAGVIGMEKLAQAIRNDPVLSARISTICVNPPPAQCGKDYNDLLKARIAVLQTDKEQKKRQETER